METAALIRQAWHILEPDLRDIGYELVEVELGRQGGAAVLRVYIDKEDGGISLDDCTRATHVLSPLLDTTDFINERYMLEISSPGWNRPVRKPAHFKRYVGETFRVTTHAPVEGRSKIKGVLTGVETDMICLDVSGTETKVHLDNIKKARLER